MQNQKTAHSMGPGVAAPRSARAGAVMAVALVSALGGAGCDMGAGNIPVDHLAQSIISLNALAFNGMRVNGMRVNGMRVNGMRVNGMRVNGMRVNGMRVNGIELDGLPLSAVRLSGIRLGAVVANELTFAGIVLEGLALDGLDLRTAAIGGVAVDSASGADLKQFIRYAAECALPGDVCISVTDLDGSAISYCGEHEQGLDPQWASEPPDLSQTGAIATCVLERGQAEGSDIEFYPVSIEAFKELMRYMIECALPEGDSVTLYDENEEPLLFAGGLGLAAEWKDGPLSATGERYVSACLAARANALQQPVVISMRGGGIPVSATERDLYDTHEGAFWANLFVDEPYINTCLVSGGGLSGRVCAQSGTCGFTLVGDCASACQSRDPLDLHYAGCNGESAVINTFLSLGQDVGFGDDHSCYRKSDGTLWCWGKNQQGQLGRGTQSSIEREPAEVEVLASYVAELSSGRDYSCARKSEGSLWCWGRNQHGQLGLGSSRSRYTEPQQVADLGLDVASVGMAKEHGCGRKTDGTLWCWGNNNHGQVGDGTQHDRSRPVQVSALGGNVARVSSGTAARSTCAITNSGHLYCWGINNHGQLGDGTEQNRSLPTLVATDAEGQEFAGVTDVCLGADHGCGRKADGTLWCWGRDHDGQLGNGVLMSTSNRPTRVAHTEPFAPSGLSCGDNHTCAIGMDGSVWCWGKNNDGQLGDGTFLDRSSPVRVVGLTSTSTHVSASDQHTCTIHVNGELWCWGKDNHHLFSPADRSSVPVEFVFDE